MRKGMSAGAVALAMLVAGGVAGAQTRRGRGGNGSSSQGTTQPGPQGSGQGARPGPGATGPSGKNHSQPLNLHKQTLGTEGIAAAARARMRNGDCAGALDGFDLALRASIDVTINRDRGLCQERLGNPYPAIDDYRIYLTEEPDAADAEGIRQRLARLEMEVYSHSSAPTDSPDEPSGGGASSASTSSSSDTTTVGATVSAGASSDEPKRDAMEDVEHDHDEMSSSVRAGKGFSLAPFFAVHKWLTQGSSFGDSTTWAEAVGAQLRYSVSAQSAFVLEAGWQHFNSTDQATISGLTSLLGYELRVPLDPRYNNQLLVGLGLGYEFLVVTPQDVSQSGVTGGAFVPRVRFGWRHLLTTSVGLDLSLDAGITGKALAQGSFLNNGSSQPAEMLAANLGLVWGL